MSRKVFNHFNYYKLVYWKLGVKTFRVGLASWIASVNEIDISTLHWHEIMLKVGAVAIVVADLWDGFFDQTMAQIKASGDTQFLTRPPEPPKT